MKLIEEIKQHGFCVLCTLLYIYHKAFKDNSGALEYVWLPKVRSCTKQIAVCCQHFRDHVNHEKVKIFPIDTNDQPADIATKTVPQDSSTYHQMKITGG